MLPNSHHLELFYFVARHGGIAAALRQMPYKLQPPTISTQLKDLAASVGVALFEPDTFTLTVAGRVLYEHLRPHYEELPFVVQRLMLLGGGAFIIGSSELAVCEYFPKILVAVRAREPAAQFALMSGNESFLATALHVRMVNATIAPLPEALPLGIAAELLAEIPLVLLTPKTVKTVEHYFQQGAKAESWLYPGSVAAVSRHFSQGLRDRKIAWRMGAAMSSLRMSEMVAAGFGPAVTLALPGVALHPAVHALPLPGFAPVKVGMLWHAPGGEREQLVLEEVKKFAQQLWPR